MEFLRNSPIKRKLTLLTMLTSGVALLLAAIAFIVFEAIDFRHALVEEVTTTAEMTGYNSSAALSFNEPASAEQALKSLGTHGPIVSAAIYDHEGQLFVSYQNANAREKFVPPPIEHNVHHFNENSVEVFRDIIFDNERVGTIYICHSLDEFWKRLWRYIFVRPSSPGPSLISPRWSARLPSGRIIRCARSRRTMTNSAASLMDSTKC